MISDFSAEDIMHASDMRKFLRVTSVVVSDIPSWHLSWIWADVNYATRLTDDDML